MRKQHLFYLAAIVAILTFVSACSGGGENTTQSSDPKTISGAEILEDAKTYAEQQCLFKYQEKILNDDKEVKDYDQKLKAINQERKKAKNYYQKKYANMPEKRVAFQRAVKASRQDSEYCNKIARQKKKE